MTEIKFRGYSKDFTENEWFYGNLIDYVNGEFSIMEKNENLWDLKLDAVKVIPESVGQLRYKNKHGEYYDGDVYSHAGYGLEVVSDLCELQSALLSGNSDDIEGVIGNIYEHSHLIDNN